MIWRTVTVFLVLLSGGVPVRGQNCQNQDQQCQDSCGTDGLTLDGSGGNIVNVAFGKPATVSSVLTDSQGKSGPGCMLVNGRTSTAYRTLDQGNASCVHTDHGDYAASWWVDLGRQYTITKLTIYRRAGYYGTSRMSGLSVLVGNGTSKQTCYSFPNSSDNTALDALPEQIDITCDPPLTGHRVWLQKHGQDTNGMYYFINVCEVQVWACKDGLYGQNCAQDCSGNCRNGDPCNNYDGHCPAGQNCQKQDQQCQDNCGTDGLTLDGSGGNIVNVAYGKSATVSSVLLDVQGVAGPGCMAVNGRTSTAYRTPSEGNANCVHTDVGDFAAYWWVDLGRQFTITNISIYRRARQQLRMSGMSVLVENQTTRQTCYSFPNNTAANNAVLDALPEKIDITCNPPLTGSKVWLQKHGEERTLTGPYFINVCEVQVWACKDGLYGQNCAQDCSGNCHNGDPCNNYDGHCPAGCREGYTGSDCRCGHCRDGMACDVTTRTCPNGCEKGWQPPYCNQMVSGSSGSGLSAGVVAGASVAAIVVLVGIAVVLYVVIRRSRLMSDSGARNTKSDSSKPNDIPITAAAARNPPEIPEDQGNPYEVAEDDNHYEIADEEEGRYINVKDDNFYDPLQAPDEEGAAYSQLQVPKKGEVLYQNQPHTPRKGNAIETRSSNT